MKEHDSERHEMAIDFAFKSLKIIVEWVAKKRKNRTYGAIFVFQH